MGSLHHHKVSCKFCNRRGHHPWGHSMPPGHPFTWPPAAQIQTITKLTCLLGNNPQKDKEKWFQEESVPFTCISSVRSLSCVQLFVTPWTAARLVSLSITNSRSLLKLMSIESVMPSNHLILCHPLLLLPSIFPRIRVFSNKSVLRIRWPKYRNFIFSISPFKEYSELISLRIDWLDILAVQGTLKSLF